MLDSETPPQSAIPAFRRTAVSCRHCQARKIRCDRKLRGSPCTNCRLDTIDCVAGGSKPQSSASRLENRRTSKLQSRCPEASPRLSDHEYLLSQKTPTPVEHPTAAQPGLPPFIRPLPSHLTGEDTAYLSHKGVFEVPDARCRSEILQSYFLFVHPLMPLLDIESFLGPMLQDNPSEKISLLLLYAVMCSGAAHVDICALQALGYKTRKAARRAFFERARVSTATSSQK